MTDTTVLKKLVQKEGLLPNGGLLQLEEAPKEINRMEIQMTMMTVTVTTPLIVIGIHQIDTLPTITDLLPLMEVEVEAEVLEGEEEEMVPTAENLNLILLKVTSHTEI